MSACHSHSLSISRNMPPRIGSPPKNRGKNHRLCLQPLNNIFSDHIPMFFPENSPIFGVFFGAQNPSTGGPPLRWRLTCRCPSPLVSWRRCGKPPAARPSRSASSIIGRICQEILWRRAARWRRWGTFNEDFFLMNTIWLFNSSPWKITNF